MTVRRHRCGRRCAEPDIVLEFALEFFQLLVVLLSRRRFAPQQVARNKGRQCSPLRHEMGSETDMTHHFEWYALCQLESTVCLDIVEFFRVRTVLWLSFAQVYDTLVQVHLVFALVPVFECRQQRGLHVQGVRTP